MYLRCGERTASFGMFRGGVLSPNQQPEEVGGVSEREHEFLESDRLWCKAWLLPLQMERETRHVAEPL